MHAPPFTQPAAEASVSAFFSFGFRPFFTFAALAAIVLPVAWLALLAGWRWPGAPLDALHWHAHEMLYGFVAAAVAGFLLTAVPGFTKRPPLTGAPLMMLAALWLLARLLAAFAGVVPAALVASADVVFLVAIASVAGRDVIASGNRRNLVLVALVALLAVTALLDQLRIAPKGITPGIHVMVLLLTLLGGRIVPSFTGNWLRAQGMTIEPSRRRWLEIAVVALTLATALADIFGAGPWLAPVAIMAALAHGVRLAGWRCWAVRREPLLWVLHTGYGWIVVGLLLLALSALGVVPRAAPLHAFGLGAMGTMILGVMSRAALGHTGRALRAPPTMALAFALTSLAALARVAVSLNAPGQWSLLMLAGVAWVLAFGLYLWHFVPILATPRVG